MEKYRDVTKSVECMAHIHEIPGVQFPCTHKLGTTVILAFRKWRQEDEKFKVIPNYTVRSKSA